MADNYHQAPKTEEYCETTEVVILREDNCNNVSFLYIYI